MSNSKSVYPPNEAILQQWKTSNIALLFKKKHQTDHNKGQSERIVLKEFLLDEDTNKEL